jgi:hypothetical protein
MGMAYKNKSKEHLSCSIARIITDDNEIMN